MNNPFAQRRDRLLQMKVAREEAARRETGGQSCPSCGEVCSRRRWSENLHVCPACGFHRPVGAYERLHQLLDPGSFQELFGRLTGGDPLNFPGYVQKKKQLTEQTGLTEAVVTARGRIDGVPVFIGVMDGRFLIGSMGAAVGEKITRLIEQAQKNHQALILICASGGARMHEGMISLMQMAKTSAALGRFHRAGGLYISVLTHPTTGGVTASFASLADITLAEPGALIGFAGPRVIEQTIGQKLPEGFQRAESLEENGFLDQIVPRAQLRGTLELLLKLHPGKGART